MEQHVLDAIPSWQDAKSAQTRPPVWSASQTTNCSTEPANNVLRTAFCVIRQIAFHANTSIMSWTGAAKVARAIVSLATQLNVWLVHRLINLVQEVASLALHSARSATIQGIAMIVWSGPTSQWESAIYVTPPVTLAQPLRRLVTHVFRVII